MSSLGPKVRGVQIIGLTQIHDPARVVYHAPERNVRDTTAMGDLRRQGYYEFQHGRSGSILVPRGMVMLIVV